MECPGCVRLRRELDAALARIAMLEAQVKELLLQLQRNSSNSSTPPSANPPDTPKLLGKPPSGRRPGGQTGHRGHHRVRLPASRVNEIITYVPTVCSACHTSLPIDPGPNDPEPGWHQVGELPEQAAILTEHQAHWRTCRCCGLLNQATIPAEVGAHAFGPRLAAMMSDLGGRFHLGKRAVKEFVEAVDQVPVSLGTAATTTVAYFVIHVHRGARGLKELLGEAIIGIVISDRWWGYNRLPLEQRQVCWAHLKRDFQKCLERGGAGELVGEIGLMVVEDVFTLWWDFRQRMITREALVAKLGPLVDELRLALERGSGCADPRVSAFCDNLQTLDPALWLFAGVEGLEPTNNHAERVLRMGVLWRKNAFGCHSESGCRFVERILTVVQTLRLQKRSVLDFLVESVIAHRLGSPAPALVIP